MLFKSLICLCAGVSYMSASCFSTININFDFPSKTINVSSVIENKDELLDVDFDGFDISNTRKTNERITKNSTQRTFSYIKKIKALNKDFVYLLNDWYPKIENRCIYKISSNLPKSYKTVFENTSDEVSSISFVASPNFVINKTTYNNIGIETYFLQKDAALAQKYISQSIKYIKLFEEHIGVYPYKKFKVVENLHQTGYAFPSYTLIGSALLRKSYVLNQSLAHEILHQYFGSSISNVQGKGNWIEGLTTYLADDYLKKLQGRDVSNRKTVLSEFQIYMNSKNDFPIKNFEYRMDKQSMLIGYSKFSHVMLMLENKLGSEKFRDLIKTFYVSNQNRNLSLKDFSGFFEENSKVDLKTFFQQWFEQTGMIDFTVENIKTHFDKKGFWVSFDVLQNENNFFVFDLPVSIQTYDNTVHKTISIKQSKQNIKLNVNSEVLSLNFDEKYTLFRTLNQKEKLLSIASLLNDKNLLALVNLKDKSKYENIKKIFPFAKLVNNDDLSYKDLKDNNIVFLDLNNDLLKEFYPKIKENVLNTYLTVKPHVYNREKVMAIVHWGDYKRKSLRHLNYYSKYNELKFSKNNIEKSTARSENGIRFELNKVALGITIQKKKPLTALYEEIKDKRIIYVSESHDDFNHHLNQLRVIKMLHENGKKVVVAMEMFQKPFQHDLDLYIQGKSSLEDFLKNTQYFERWKFDYNLYKPIIDYAKSNQIKILAINIDREITSQVYKKGLFSLSKKQRNLLPTSIDQSNFKYQKDLHEIFNRHIPKKNMKSDSLPHQSAQANSDFFYQSQLIWDETMAENIDNFLQTNKDVSLVVLAGSGHIQNHDGIPSRVYRRNNLTYSVILNEVMGKEGDIFLENSTKSEIAKAKKLGVFLKSGQKLIVTKNKEGSISEKIGLKKDDLILEVNGQEVNKISDLKRVLYFLDSFEHLYIKVLRGKSVKVLKAKSIVK